MTQETATDLELIVAMAKKIQEPSKLLTVLEPIFKTFVASKQRLNGAGSDPVVVQYAEEIEVALDNADAVDAILSYQMYANELKGHGIVLPRVEELLYPHLAESTQKQQPDVDRVVPGCSAKY
jgi:hypothetical protein